ncbi:MAG TPA: MCE family protein [Nocardioidaceae bacterium]|nr:MCE family protein [Nocardioidaceae bacterium]
MNRSGRASTAYRAVSGRVLGIAFLALLLLFVWLTYAIYSKKFVDYVPVDVRTSTIGLQLNTRADVKLRGMIVGEVRSTDLDEGGAVLHVGLDPDLVDQIPDNVTALIVPKTLFGEKYVALQIPADPAEQSIEADDVIEQASVPIEVEKVLDDVYPLLTAVQPRDLASTLSTLATALGGRGERIGDNFVRLDGYLTKINPLVPRLVQDLRDLGTVADVYAGQMPELARLLENTVVTANTLTGKEDEIKRFLNDVRMLSDTTRDFLEANGASITEVARTSVPVLDLLAEYSPEYPCLLKGLVNWLPRVEEQFRGHIVHIDLELLPDQPEGYTTADDPKYGTGLGPQCLTLPNPPYSQKNPPPPPPRNLLAKVGITGGYDRWYRPAPADLLSLVDRVQPPGSDRPGVDGRIGALLGTPPDAVPDVAGLLLGPSVDGPGVGR